MGYVIGVDGGGSKTICVLVQENGEIIGRGESGAANYQSIGIDRAINAIYTAIAKAIQSSPVGLANIPIHSICLGLAGVGRRDDMELVRQRFLSDLQTSGLGEIINHIPKQHISNKIIICHDALISLVGGIGRDVGVVVAAGTGSIAFGRNPHGESKRVGGWGYLIGDEGSAYQIAIAALRAAMKSYDGRGESTGLTEVFKNHFQLDNLEDLINIIYRQGWGVQEIASLAPIVDNLAGQGDRVASNIIEASVDELLLATVTVIQALFTKFTNIQTNLHPLEVVTTGSVWQGKSLLRQLFISRLQLIYPGIKVISPRNEPAYGAALFALRQFSKSE